MGRIARVLSFVRAVRNAAQISDVKTDPGGGANITAQHFGAPGDDAHPLPDDYAYLSDEAGTGREAALGYVDTLNEPKALAGDRRLYARNRDGAVVVDVWLKNTGEAVTTNDNGSFALSPSGAIRGGNDNGSFELRADGHFVVNGVTIDPQGNVNSPTSISSPSIVANGKELAGHNHPAGSPPGNTGANN